MKAAQTTVEVTPFPALSEREREVAMRLAIGDANTDIADDLKISVKTLDSHRANILRKLRLRHNVDLARYAIREGYVNP